MDGFIIGTWYFVKEYGWRALLCNIFNIDSKHHDMYQQAFAEGMSSIYGKDGPLSLDATILHLACAIDDIEPYRTRRICQIRGYADAKKERSNVKVRGGASRRPS